MARNKQNEKNIWSVIGPNMDRTIEFRTENPGNKPDHFSSNHELEFDMTPSDL